MPTTLYLIRHGATAANLERPYRLQGRRTNPPLDVVGIRQAELTRDMLAIRPIHRIYASPLERAVQTARIIAAPRRQLVHPIEALTECDVGRWEARTWDEVRAAELETYQRFQADPARHGYPEGETFADVAKRVVPALGRLLLEHEGESILVVGHHIVNRVYLAGLLGLPPAQAKLVKLDNCGISTVVWEKGQAQVATLNATFHLHGVSAAA